jgi:L-fuculose-phosphate aldolase
MENCDLCANSIFRTGYAEPPPEQMTFRREHPNAAACAVPSANGHAATASGDMEQLVRTITDQVMAALSGAK